MPITNMMSVDLEDYYCDLPFSEWQKYESRVIKNTQVILDLFEKYDVKATFFVLGYIAEKFPGMIKKISELGHEIASHSYAHIDLRKVSKKQFEDDFLKSVSIIEKITGKKVEGFRAPFFSIDKNNSWVFEILSRHIRYDSSIFPVRTPLYGIHTAPRFIYKPSMNNVIEEDNLYEFTMEMARKIANGPPIAIRLSKLMLYKGLEFDLDTAMKMAAAAETITLTSKDHLEGTTAFRESREPKYEGS